MTKEFLLYPTTVHKIDVLIPTYRPKEAHLTEAIKSLHEQSFTNWQALIHDDHTDDSEAESIVQPFLSDKRVKFERSSHRLGIGGNWNACVAKTQSEFVAFLFQDDLWEPHYLESAVKILQSNPSVGFVSMEHTYLPEGGQSLGPIYGSVVDFRKKNVTPGLHRGKDILRFWADQKLTPNFIGEPSFVVIRREMLNRAGKFLEDMPQFLDSEMWLRLLQHTDWFNLTGNYGAFRVHPEAASARNEANGAGITDRLRCFDRLISSLSGDDRKHATQARNAAIGGMVRKFFQRRKAGKAVGGGSGAMKSIVLRHPILIGRAVLGELIRTK